MVVEASELLGERRHSDGEEKVFIARDEYGKSSNAFKQIVALAIWLGAIHFDAALVLIALLFFPLSRALLFVLYSLSLSFHSLSIYACVSSVYQLISDLEMRFEWVCVDANMSGFSACSSY